LLLSLIGTVKSNFHANWRSCAPRGRFGPDALPCYYRLFITSNHADGACVLKYGFARLRYRRREIAPFLEDVLYDFSYSNGRTPLNQCHAFFPKSDVGER